MTSTLLNISYNGIILYDSVLWGNKTPQEIEGLIEFRYRCRETMSDLLKHLESLPDTPLSEPQDPVGNNVIRVDFSRKS